MESKARNDVIRQLELEQLRRQVLELQEVQCYSHICGEHKFSICIYLHVYVYI